MCVCAVLQQKGYKICPRNPCGLRNSLVRVQNVVGRTSWGATPVNSAGHFDFDNTQTNWQCKRNNQAVTVTAAVLPNMIICCHQYWEISWPSLNIPDINYTMSLWKAHKVCTFHLADFLFKCMTVNLHVWLCSETWLYLPCFYYPSINNSAWVKIDLVFSIYSQSSETGIEPFRSSVPFLQMFHTF